MQIDDVVSQLIVLGLNGFEVVIEHLVIADLFFKFLDVAFFPLTESSLENQALSAAIQNDLIWPLRSSSRLGNSVPIPRAYVHRQHVAKTREQMLNWKR